MVSFSFFAQKLDDEKDHIPPDFGKTKTHIVFQTIAGDAPLNKAVKKAFEVHYTGSFEIISHKDDSDKIKKDPDTKYYWFKASKQNQSDGSTWYSFGLREFNTFKVFQISNFNHTYGKLLPAYVKALEEARKQNGN